MQLDETERLYGNQSFSRLRDNGCFYIYDIHIGMLKDNLKIVTKEGDYNRAYVILKAIKHFEKLKKQASERT